MKPLQLVQLLSAWAAWPLPGPRGSHDGTDATCILGTDWPSTHEVLARVETREVGLLFGCFFGNACRSRLQDAWSDASVASDKGMPGESLYTASVSAKDA